MYTIGKQDIWQLLTRGFAVVLVVIAGFAVAKDAWWLFGLPVLACLAAITLLDYRWLYFAFFGLVPFSTEVDLPGGLGTDLPTEPIMLALTGIAVVLALMRWREVDTRYITHSFTLILVVHILWILVTAVLSTHPVISFKFLLAKLWYVIPFYAMTIYILRDDRMIEWCWRLFFVGLAVSVSTVVIRFIPYNFEFKYIEKIMQPFFRNHVNYAAIMAVSLPWLWALWQRSGGKLMSWSLVGIVFFATATYYSYTRAAIASIPIAIIMYYVIKLRLLRVVVGFASIGAIVLLAHLLTDRNWLEYAPDYTKTVSHRSFDDLLSATAKGEDISTMERVYRWVAAGRMIADKPLHGFGPGSFYESYRPYTVTAFKTYVSDNPQKSGIHSYYLMTWVDQGVIGLLIFLLLTVWPLLYGERLYHLIEDGGDKIWLMASLLCLIVIDVIILINDLLEVDKVGPLYFFSLAIIVVVSMRHRDKATVDPN
jgi:O-antigen ligase